MNVTPDPRCIEPFSSTIDCCLATYGHTPYGVGRHMEVLISMPTRALRAELNGGDGMCVPTRHSFFTFGTCPPCCWAVNASGRAPRMRLQPPVVELVPLPVLWFIYRLDVLLWAALYRLFWCRLTVVDYVNLVSSTLPVEFYGWLDPVPFIG